MICREPIRRGLSVTALRALDQGHGLTQAHGVKGVPPVRAAAIRARGRWSRMILTEIKQPPLTLGRPTTSATAFRLLDNGLGDG